ncbi:DNA polymerase subunit gamma-2, mitochondrial [Elysia marginata]|uniref:DNA polymerase subunit gamma-2, mitochondrial n=1 Tax=Elysia marginata TaxID=1093978 RepID=A0AAV4H7B7_9GAST|nr:DNA polymerase subunit gamma-2, mitochondrial [Elysia marginata]
MSSAVKTALNEASGLAHLLRHRGFLDLMSTTLGGEEYNLASYGPLGTLLRKNILNQWGNLMITTQTNVFPIENPSIENRDPDASKTFSRLRCTLQQDCTSKYAQVLKLTNGKLPISIASVGTCFVPEHKLGSREEVTEKALLLGSCLETKLILQNYIPPSNTNAIHDYWLQTRLSWWKKYSRSPERFTVASNGNGGREGNEDKENLTSNAETSAENSLHIIYEFPWGQEVVESVSNLSDSLHRLLPQPEKQAHMVKC